jgi:hypothetical protein
LSPRYTLFALEKRTTPSSFKTSSVGELFAHDPRCIRLRNPCVLREGRCRCPWRGHAAAQDFNVVAPVEQTVTSYFEATGNTAAVNSVDLVAHVQGFVEEISHTDGAFVKKSAALFTIEPEPHRLKVETAKSAVASAQAALTQAEADPNGRPTSSPSGVPACRVRQGARATRNSANCRYCEPGRPDAADIVFGRGPAILKRRETSKERPSNKDAACISRQSQPEPSNLMSQILS